VGEELTPLSHPIRVKHMCSEVSGVDNSSFWDEKASDYPLPGEDESLERNFGLIDIIAAKGVPIGQSTILDIGCGVGGFTLPLAKRGAVVTALDFSRNMLGKLSKEAKRLGLEDVRCLHCSWKDIDPVVLRLEKAFDLVLSAFSQAVETEQDLLEMERCSRKWCAYIATGRIQRDAPMEQLFRTLHVPRNPRPDIRGITPILKNMGRDFLLEFITITMNEPTTSNKLIEQIALRLEAAGKKPNWGRIAAGVSSLPSTSSEGVQYIQCWRQAEIGILIWKVDEVCSQ